MSERPLLLHSLAEFRSILVPLLDAVAPSRLVEIGGEGGQFTELLSDWAAGHDAELLCVEPFPSPPLLELEAAGRVTIVRGKSPAALAEVGPVDLAVIDGDHNYHVVSGELRALLGEPRTQALVLHDVGWPCARRDTYYDPEDVPDDARHPYSYDLGAVPGEERLQLEGGFRGEGVFAAALEEGGERNGVLTALEDALAERDDLEFRLVPAIFGLGVVFPRESGAAGALRELLDPLHDHDLVQRLEANRLELYLALVRAQDEAHRPARGVAGLVAGLEAELEAQRAENARLRAQSAEDTARQSANGPPTSSSAASAQ
jgi:hypothetical protein